MAKVKTNTVSTYQKQNKGKGKQSKKSSTNKSSKNYVKPYKGQGR